MVLECMAMCSGPALHAPIHIELYSIQSVARDLSNLIGKIYLLCLISCPLCKNSSQTDSHRRV